MDRGYVAIWRKIQDHVFYKEKREYSKFEAWIDILMEAQHCKNEKDVLIKMKLFKCGYGESLKSIRTWGRRWGWGEAKVKRFFDLLVKMNQIRYKNETVTSRVTVLNYSSYDPKLNSYETRAKHERNSIETQANTDKNEKNVKNENIYPDKEILNFVNGFQHAIKKELGNLAPDVTEELIINGCKTIDKLIRKDKFDKNTVFETIRWAYKDDFWSNQVRSIAHIRKKSEKNGLSKFQNIVNSMQKLPVIGNQKQQLGFDCPTLA